MKFCERLGALPEEGGYFDQPADTMMRWHEYAAAEGEAMEMRQKIEEAKAKARH